MSFLAYFPPFIQDILEPSIMLAAAMKAYAHILFQNLWQDGRYPVNHRGRAFARFWSDFSSGPPPDPFTPLVGSAALVPSLLAEAAGLVLDIGPGSGSIIRRFEPAASRISRIYGAEPMVELHSQIRKNAAAAGMSSKYEVIHASATRGSICKELVRLGELQSAGDTTAVFDNIVCVRVLCSVPDLKTTISDLHSLLKPGGKLLVCEHTVNMWRSPRGSAIARIAQQIYMLLGWSYFVGDCSMTRDIEGALREGTTSKWSAIDLKRSFDQSCFTYICGTLTKKGL